jgi:hypothetical protein
VDEIDAPAWHPDLLDWLAEDLVAHGYDLKHTMAMILTSRAYQRPAVSGAEGSEKQYVFRGPYVRRLTAEQFRDALAEVAGVGYQSPSPTVDWLAGEPESVRADYARRVTALTVHPPVPGETNHWQAWFGGELVVTGKVDQALAVVAASQEFTVLVNAHEVGGARKAQDPVLVDFASQLRPGTNYLVLRVGKKPEPPAAVPPPAVAALVAIKQGRKNLESQTDGSWRVAGGGSAQLPDPAQVRTWPVIGQAATFAPASWLNTNQFAMTVRSLEDWGNYRAAWVAADPLAVALDRPNREQVCTGRPIQPTTLQALELSNGATLAGVLQQGARQLLESNPPEAKRLSRAIYRQALGREPTRRESSLIQPLLGAPVKAEAVEDLLWSVAMLPEFQLIY